MQLFPGGKSRARRLQQPCFCRRYGRPPSCQSAETKSWSRRTALFSASAFPAIPPRTHWCRRRPVPAFRGGHPVRQPFLHGGHAGLGHAHQRDSAALQLPLRLDEIASVRPQRGGFPCHTQRSRRTCKARQPRTAAPTGRRYSVICGSLDGTYTPSAPSASIAARSAAIFSKPSSSDFSFFVVCILAMPSILP